MGPSAKTISNLLGLLYGASASLEPEGWPVFLEAVRQATKADKAYFVLIDPRKRCNFSLQLGFDPAWQRAYSEHYYKHDLLYEGLVAAKRLHGEFAGTTPSVVSEADFKRSLFYNEFILPQAPRNWSWCAVAMSELEGGLDGGMGIQRTTGTQPLDQEQVALLRILSPHLHRAFNTYRTLSEWHDQQEVLRQSLEVLDVALLTLDGEGRVLGITPAAKAIVDACDGLQLDKGYLQALVLNEQSRLHEIVMGAVATGAGRVAEAAVPLRTDSAPEVGGVPLWTPAFGGAILISRRPPKRPLQLVVSPLPAGEVFFDGSSPAALVFISDPDARPASRTTVLRALYGMTPTECRIADLLVTGYEVSDVAESLGMTVETARFHLKTVFRKTHTGRQSELVRLILGLPGNMASRS